jgi:hypothetical protein
VAENNRQTFNIWLDLPPTPNPRPGGGFPGAPQGPA